MLYKWVGVLLVSIILVGVAAAKPRVWSDKKGNNIEAEYVKIMAGKVMLKKADGKILKVPISGLCQKDRDFLADLIPPEIEIEVDIDKDSKKLSDYEYYVRKKETISGKVELVKKNKEKCNRQLVCHIYVLGRDLQEDVAFVMSYDKHKFNFIKKKTSSFATTPSSTEYSEGYGWDKHGSRYEGYLVYVEDSKGEMITVDSSKGMYESRLNKIKGSSAGKKFTW